MRIVLVPTVACSERRNQHTLSPKVMLKCN
jgi:hypothetical protein